MTKIKTKLFSVSLIITVLFLSIFTLIPITKATQPPNVYSGGIIVGYPYQYSVGGTVNNTIIGSIWEVENNITVYSAVFYAGNYSNDSPNICVIIFNATDGDFIAQSTVVEVGNLGWYYAVLSHSVDLYSGNYYFIAICSDNACYYGRYYNFVQNIFVGSGLPLEYLSANWGNDYGSPILNDGGYHGTSVYLTVNYWGEYGFAGDGNTPVFPILSDVAIFMQFKYSYGDSLLSCYDYNEMTIHYITDGMFVADYGNDLNFVCTPDHANGWSFYYWTINGMTLEDDTQYIWGKVEGSSTSQSLNIYNVTSSLIVVAHERHFTYLETIGLTVVNDNTIAGSVIWYVIKFGSEFSYGTGTFDIVSGDFLEFTANANDGYSFSSWVITDGLGNIVNTLDQNAINIAFNINATITVYWVIGGGADDGGGVDVIIPTLTLIFGNVTTDIIFVIFGVICGLLTWKLALTGLIAGIGISTLLCVMAGILPIWAVGLCIVLDVTLIILGSGLLNKTNNNNNNKD